MKPNEEEPIKPWAGVKLWHIFLACVSQLVIVFIFSGWIPDWVELLLILVIIMVVPLAWISRPIKGDSLLAQGR